MGLIKSKKELIEGCPFFMTIAPYISDKYKEYLYENVEYLYHYTNLNGMLGIIETLGFWATHIKYMNDSKEYLHGLSLCNKIIENYSKNGTSDQVKFLNKVSECLNDEDSENFVISLCSNGDLLSQWRGYSRGQYGVSIGFSYNEIFNFTTSRDNEYLHPQKVIYNTEVQKGIITEILEIGVKNIEFQGLDLYIIPKEIARTLKYLIPLFKDISFSEEKEWRIVTTNFSESEEKHPLKFRTRDNIIVPYVSLPLRKKMSEEKENLPINQIIVGPSDSNDFTMESINYFLKEKNYHNTKVIRSTIPYR